jgi:hypothetical protein
MDIEPEQYHALAETAENLKQVLKRSDHCGSK